MLAGEVFTMFVQSVLGRHELAVLSCVTVLWVDELHCQRQSRVGLSCNGADHHHLMEILVDGAPTFPYRAMIALYIPGVVKLGAFGNNLPELYEYNQSIGSTEFLNEFLDVDEIDIFMDDGFHHEDAIMTTPQRSVRVYGRGQL